nr:MAG TPA: hypothetical protein [Caudoviricetes sp.]
MKLKTKNEANLIFNPASQNPRTMENRIQRYIFLIKF